MNKKNIVIIGIIACLGGGIFYLNNSNKTENKTNQLESSVQSNGIKVDITPIENLNALKAKSDLIIECEGTSIQEKRDYKGIPSIITTVKVKEVFKGDKDIKEVKVIQMENVDVQPKDGEKLVMFLMKGDGIDNPDCYGVVGAGQGIYIIDNDKSKKSTLNSESSTTLKPQAIKNENILKELSGEYKDLKTKLK